MRAAKAVAKLDEMESDLFVEANAQLGILTTLELSTRLAQAGFTIVSGLAKGIDTSAHLGALSANSSTIGVLGCDLFSIYPTENRELADVICEHGALFSFTIKVCFC